MRNLNYVQNLKKGRFLVFSDKSKEICSTPYSAAMRKNYSFIADAISFRLVRREIFLKSGTG